MKLPVLNFDQIGEISQEVVQRVYGLSPLQAASMDYFKFEGITIPLTPSTALRRLEAQDLSQDLEVYLLKIAFRKYTVTDYGDYVELLES